MGEPTFVSGPYAQVTHAPSSELQDFVETAAIGLHWVAEDGTILWANQADYEPLGYRAEEYIGHNISEFHADADALADILGRLTRGERITDYRARLLCKDGSFREVAITSSALFDEKRRFVHTRCFTRLLGDAADQSRLPPGERHADALRLLIENVQDYAIFLLDPTGRIETWNSGAQRFKGYRAEEAIGQHFSIFYTSEDIQAGRPQYLLARAAAEGRVEDEGWRVRRDGSRFWANVVITALRDRSGTLYGFGKVTRDLTARKKAEEDARRLAEERAARAASEAGLSRMKFLARAGIMLGANLDYEVTLQSVARLVVPELGDNCVVDVVDEKGVIRRVAEAAADPAREPLLRRLRAFPAGGGRRSLVAEVVKTGETVFIDRFDEAALRSVSPADEYSEIVRQLAPRSSVTVPLVARGRTLGAVTFGMAESGRSYTEADISLAEELGRRAGVALENALLFKAEARARAEANANRAQLEATLMAMSEGVVVLDMSGGVVLANDAQARMIGYSGGDELKRDLGRITREFELFGLDGQPIAPEDGPGARVLRGETLSDLELRGRRKDTGEEWYISFSGAPVRDESGRQVLALVITRDVTARKRAEAAMREAIQVRDDFLSIAGHELRTPLAAMLMHIQGVERLAQRENAPPRLVERLGKASAAAARLEKLVSELLDVSRIQSGRLTLERERFDLVQLVREIVERHADQAAEAGSALDFTAAAEVVGVWDRGRLDQAVSNLVNNAIKYGRGKPISLRLTVERGAAVLRVVDQGIGIPASEQQRIFERFERAAGAREYGGIGLGLWIARQVVEASGGRIEVESEPGRGTTFTMTLPIEESRVDR